MDNIKSKWKPGLFLLYALIILLAVTFLYSYTDADDNDLFLTPVFEDARGWDIYTLEDGTRKDITVQELYDSSGKTIYLSQTMDKKWENSGYTTLELDGAAWQESVFLDGELLYTVNPSLDNRIGFVDFPQQHKTLPETGENVRLSLPPDYGGKTLTIAVAYNTALEYHGGLPMILLSSENFKTQQLVSTANKLSMPATAYMAAAILLLGLFFYNWYYGQKSYSILLLMLAALLQSLRVLLNFEFYFSSHFSLNFIPADLLIPLSVGLPVLYMLAQMKRWKKWYAPFALIPLTLSLTFHIIARFPVFSFLSAYPHDTMLYIPLLALAVFAVLEWKDKNTVYRLFTPALFSFAAIAIVTALGLVITGNRTAAFVNILCRPIIMLSEALQCYGSVLLILSGAVSFILTMKKAADTQSEVAVLSARNELIQENIQSIQDSSAEIAGMRHDMLRHLHTMLDLSREGDEKRLVNYLEDLTSETEAILPVKLCQHPVVNALVTRALLRAKKENIRMDVHVEVPASLPIADNDLCTLVMNMLDNAIEAVCSLPAGKDRTIELTMHVRGRYLFVETVNAYDGTVLKDETTGLLQSTKGEGHGYGMKAMSDIARKYASKLQIKQEQDMIVIRTALLIPEET